MSTRDAKRQGIPPPPDDIVVEGEDSPPDPDSLRAMLQDPGVRNYLFAGLVGLAMVFVSLFEKGVDPFGGILIVVIGGAGMFLRWPGGPVFFLLVLLWFLIFPFGLPPPEENRFEIEAGRFRVADILLAGSVVVFLASHYRVFGLTAQAMPFEQIVPGKGAKKPVRRPPELITPGEITRLLYLAAGVVLAGQLIWLFVTSVELDGTRTIPLRLAETRHGLRAPADGVPSALRRFLLVAGLVFFGVLLARLVFGYWRLRVMNPAEGGMILQDGAWNETRREQMRVAWWRAWGWRRVADRQKKKGRPEQGGAK